MMQNVEHQAFVAVPPLSEGCPPCPACVGATSLSSEITQFGHQLFPAEFVEMKCLEIHDQAEKTHHWLHRYGDERVSGEAGTTSCPIKVKLQYFRLSIGLHCDPF